MNNLILILIFKFGLYFLKGYSQILDVFLLYKSPSKVNLYHENGEDFVSMKLLDHFGGDELRIHLVGDRKRIHRHTNGLVSNIYYHDFFSFPETYHEFRHLYKHQSVNPFEYEFLCFYRWILYSNIVERYSYLNFSSILVMDTDVLVFDKVVNILEDIKTHTKQVDMQMYMLIPGTFSFWTPKGIHKFSSYLTDVYKKNDLDLIQYIKTHGSIFNENRPATIIPYDPNTNMYVHFSDMFALLAFILENKDIAVSADRKKLICNYISNSHDIKFLNFQNGLPISDNNKICLIHLQADHKRFTSTVFKAFKANATVQIDFR